jgi:hypothetical protein
MAVKPLMAIPDYRDSVKGKFLDSFVRLTVHLARQYAPGELQYVRIGLVYIDIVRSNIWNDPRECGAENLLWPDDDITSPYPFEISEANAGGSVDDLYRLLDPATPPLTNGFPRPAAGAPAPGEAT